MNKYITIFFACLVLSLGMRNVFIYSWFKVNQASIAKTLCMKKEIKDNDCGGCCVLKKSLEKENTGDGNMSLEQKQGEVVFCEIIFSVNQSTLFSKKDKTNWKQLSFPIFDGFSSSSYQPPEFI